MAFRIQGPEPVVSFLFSHCYSLRISPSFQKKLFKAPQPGVYYVFVLLFLLCLLCYCLGDNNQPVEDFIRTRPGKSGKEARGY